jgi:beta-glucosidase
MGVNICDFPFGESPGFPNMPCPKGKAVDKSGIPAAVALAKAADVAVLFIGSDQTTEAENFDRSSLRLAGVQSELVKAVVAAQPKSVIVLINGGPLAIEHEADSVPAIIESFMPGQLGGEGIIDALSGATNNFGKMPYTTYFANFTQRDVRDVDLASGTGITYRHFSGPVLWPFGFGLSYTTFSYKWSNSNILETRLDTLSKTPVDHEVTVTNSGSMAGDCVVLAFLVSGNFRGTNRDEQGAPLRKLFGFQRLKAMQPREARSVLFSSTANDLSVVDHTGSRWLKQRRVS